MRSVALWILGASVAFLATAGAFLLLASLVAGSPSSDLIPRSEPSTPKSQRSALVLRLPEDRLEGLKRGPGQRLAVDVENGSEEELSSVNLALMAASENTAQPRARYYWATSEKLAPGEVATVEFEIDLSSPTPDEGSEVGTGVGPQEDREILEIRATTSGGASAVKTAVLAP